MQKHNVGTWSSESDIKMEVDDEGTEEEGYGEEAARTKECIMFHNQVYALATLMIRKLKNGTDLSLIEDMLYSLDRTFRRGVAWDVESFFNALVLIIRNYPNSISC